MKIKKLSLRLRLTIMNILILLVMSIILTISANISANTLMTATKTIPALTNSEVSIVTPSVLVVNAKRTFQNETMKSMICIILIGSGVTFYFSGKVLKPLGNLSNQVNNININNLSKKLEVPQSGDEVESLTKSFNKMMEVINSSYIMQKNFSANVAHELNTPLAVLQTKIDVFNKKKDRSVEEYRDLLCIINSNTQRLSQLVKNMLELTNDEEIDINQKVCIKELIEETVFELESIANDKNITIEVSGEEACIYGNDSFLQRTFYNLIENAIKYNVANGKVLINISNEKNNVIIEVKDSGNGIDDEFKSKIFEPFFRIDKSRNREIGGSGLGLAMVKHIVDKHNATIEVKDNELGGSTFILKYEKCSIHDEGIKTTL